MDVRSGIAVLDEIFDFSVQYLIADACIVPKLVVRLNPGSPGIAVKEGLTIRNRLEDGTGIQT